MQRKIVFPLYGFIIRSVAYMVLRLAICDADEKYREQTIRAWKAELPEGSELKILVYENGQALLEDNKKEDFVVDLLITDVQLPDTDGWKVLQEIRKKRVSTEVVVQSEAEGTPVRIHRFRLEKYLQKPVTEEQMRMVAKAYYEKFLEQKENYIMVAIQGSYQSLPLKKVCYFESDIRKIRAVLTDRTVEFYMQLNDLAKELKEKGDEFCRCHQSYLVNKMYISSVAPREIILKDGRKLPVSRRYQKSLEGLR